MKKAHIRFQFLEASKEDRLQGIVRLKVLGATGMMGLRAYYHEMGHTTYEADIQRWEPLGTERQSHFFHEIRDRIAEAMGDPSNGHKIHLKKMLKKEFGPLNEDGSAKSTKNYSKTEWSILIEGAIWYAEQAEVDMRNLIPEWREIVEEARDTQGEAGQETRRALQRAGLTEGS